MPSPAEILRLLAETANGLAPIAIVWHAIVLAALVGLATGWRPSIHVGVLALAAPALSVGLAAMTAGNPFNGITFVALAAGLAYAASRLDDTRVTPGPAWARWTGLALIAFGWIYPHFLTGSWTRYVYAAPLGLIPCPTLAALAGFTLLGGGFSSRAVPWLLAAWTAFYAIFGIGRLGVLLDAPLVIACGGLVALAVSPGRRSRPRPLPPTPLATGSAP